LSYEGARDPVGRAAEVSRGLGWSLAFSPDGKVLAAAHEGGVRRWDVATGKEIIPEGTQPIPQALSVSRDGRLVAALGEGQVRLWDAVSSRIRWTLAAPPIHGFALARTPRAMAFLCVALSPDGKLLAAGSDDWHVYVWDTTTGKRTRRLLAHTSAVTSVAFTPEGLLTTGQHADAAWWDPKTGGLLDRLELVTPAGTVLPERLRRRSAVEDAPWPRALAVPGGQRALVGRPPTVSPGGRLLALDDGGLQVWDRATLRRRWRHDGLQDSHMGRLLAIVRRRQRQKRLDLPPCFAPDGRHLAVISVFGVMLMDARNGKELRLCDGCFSPVDMAFSPDGRLLAAANNFGVYLWEVATGTLLAREEGHRGGLTAVAFSGDGRTLATAGLDTTIHLWNVEDLLRKPVAATPKVAELWEQLASPDTGRAAEAMNRLAAHPGLAVEAVRLRLHPAAPVEQRRLARWLADLDDQSPAARERAARELEKLDDLAAPALERFLAGQPTREGRRRAELLQAKLAGPVSRPELMRALRAVELMERVGSAEALDTLERLAAGARGARLTCAAQGALCRMKSR
jgi:WD40 repeat protein